MKKQKQEQAIGEEVLDELLKQGRTAVIKLIDEAEVRTEHIVPVLALSYMRAGLGIHDTGRSASRPSAKGMANLFAV